MWNKSGVRKPTKSATKGAMIPASRALLEHIPSAMFRTTVGNNSPVCMYAIPNAADMANLPIMANVTDKYGRSVTVTKKTNIATRHNTITVEQKQKPAEE